MITLTIRSLSDQDLTSCLVREVTHTHPAWVHAQLGTEDESELQSYLDCLEIRPYLERPGCPDAEGIYYAGPVYHIEASYEHDGALLDCSQAEVLGDAFGRLYTDQDEAEAMAYSLQQDVEDSDLDPSTAYSVYEGGRQIYSAA